MTETITFEPLADTHMPLMARWLANPVVAEFYEEGDTTVAGLTAHYRDAIDGNEPTHGYVVHVNGEPIGYIQAVEIDGYPDYAAQLHLVPGSVGIDILIGEDRWRGRGVGSRALRQFTEEIVFGRMGAPQANIGPSPDNMRAIRSYERAGFRFLKTVEVTADEPWNTGTEYVMVQGPG
jgi:aminoglycoside 6'-N-acetyltransferase